MAGTGNPDVEGRRHDDRADRSNNSEGMQNTGDSVVGERESRRDRIAKHKLGNENTVDFESDFRPRRQLLDSKRDSNRKGDEEDESRDGESELKFPLEKERRRRRRRRDRKESDEGSSSSASDSHERERRKRRAKKDRHRESKKSRCKHSRRRDDSSSSSSDSSLDTDGKERHGRNDKDNSDRINTKLAVKLQARGETIEERKQRRLMKAEQKRAAFIATKFGYTADDNPFHDPNIHQAFTWKKKEEAERGASAKKQDESTTATLEEIEKLRQRRKQRELQLEEMERIRREESRMRELEGFDEWARKEEGFHLQQQRQRSAIRLIQGRERPIDVLAKNMLSFGVDRENSAAVKYKERYNALDQLEENLEVEVNEPYRLLHKLKQHELEEVLADIDEFLTLEREASLSGLAQNAADSDPILTYWLALKTVALDELKLIKSGGEKGSHAETVREVCIIFRQGQSTSDLEQMKLDIHDKLRQSTAGGSDQFGTSASFDRGYWQTVLEQLEVHLAKKALSEIHSQMLARQLARLEQKRLELSKIPPEERQKLATGGEAASEHKKQDINLGEEGEQEGGFGDVEEHELVEETGPSFKSYSWADKYRPRKPRYFNRVKTGYDWNKYNKTHYDRDNPPPKTVQGYKFNIFYPDLIDPSKTPQYELLKADSDDFCIIRFSAGPPYEDVAFKIINREWNKSRKHGFKSTFERGILSLYFNFKTSWYRR